MTETSPPYGVANEEPDRTVRILQAAERCFAGRSFHGTSLQRIAKAASVSKALILYHFESKERLLFAVLERMLGETVEAVQLETASLPRGLEAGLRGLDVMASALERWSPLMAGLAGAMVNDRSDIRLRTKSFADGAVAIIETSMRETLGGDVERLPISPHRMARLLLSAVNGIILSANHGTGDDAAEQMEDLKAVLRAGVLEAAGTGRTEIETSATGNEVSS